MESVVIQKATSNDAENLTQISFTAKRFWKYPEDWIDSWKKQLTITPNYIASCTVFKLLIKNDVIGFCSIKRDGRHYEIDNLWILPEFMGNGYGKLLLETALKNRCPSGATIRVYSDPNAEGFYEKQGFKTVGQFESYPKGRFLPIMEKIYN